MFVTVFCPKRGVTPGTIKTDKNLTGCDDSNLCESRKRGVRTLLYLWLFFFDFVKFTENMELPAI